MRRLIVFSYAMDSQNPVFPHQIEIIEDLSKTWDLLCVITYEANVEEIIRLPKNIRVFNLNWHKYPIVFSAIKFLFIFLYLFITQRRFVIFSFMTETLSALIAPFSRLMNIWHVLWYAHTSHPKRLTWCHFWVDRIVTSTPESISLKSQKIVPIGQAVNQNIFRCLHRQITDNRSQTKLIHVGRLDPSKNITTLISVFHSKFASSEAILHLVGSPTRGNEHYLMEIKSKIRELGLESRIFLHGSQNQNRVKELLCQSDIFLHAFIGSLDKTLIEAVFCKTFVITANVNFIEEFGSFTELADESNLETFLGKEVDQYILANATDLISIIESRYSSAHRNHSRSQWLSKLDGVLQNESL